MRAKSRSEIKSSKPKDNVEPRLEAASPTGFAQVSAFLGVFGPWIGLLLVALKWFGPVPLSSSQAADLTRGGQFWVKMERDIPLYVSFTAVLLAGLVLLPWGKLRVSRATPGHFFAALGGFGCAVLPACIWGELAASARASSAGALALKLLVLAAVGASLSWISFRSVYRYVPGSVEGRKESALDFGEPPGLGWPDIVVFVGLAFLLFIPEPKLLAGRFFQIEDFAHWNGFLMTWALAFKHGAALYRDVIPIYGGAWSVLFAWLSPFRKLAYSDCISFCIGFSVFYYFLFYYLSRYIIGKRSVSACLSLLVVVGLTFFSGEPESKSIIWRWPSSTPMRAPCDLLFFLSLLFFCRRPTIFTASAFGLCAGMAPLFAIDTGIFLFSTFVMVWVAALIICKTPDTFKQLKASLATLVGVALFGFLVMTRGRLFDPETFANYLEFRNRVSSGLGLIPIAELDGWWVGFFALSLLILFGATLYGFSRHRSSGDPSYSIFWAVGVYGLQRMVYFMGRTTPGTLQVAILPCLLCVGLFLAHFLRRPVASAAGGSRKEGVPQEAASPVFPIAVNFALLSVTVFLLAISRDVPNYPAVWNPRKSVPELGSVSLNPEHPDVEGLPEDYRQYASAFMKTSQSIREHHRNGLRVQVLDACSTTMYALADLPPLGKDANEFDRADTSWAEIERLRRKISTEGADVIVLNRLQLPWPRAFCQEALSACREEISLYYTLSETNYCLEVWRRKPSRTSG